MCLYHARPLPVKSFIGERLKDDVDIVQDLNKREEKKANF